MRPDSSRLRKIIRLNYPQIGFYDAPDPELFKPFVTSSGCMFSCFDEWYKGKSLHLTEGNFGCTDCGRILAGHQSLSREKMIAFQKKAEVETSHQMKSCLAGSKNVYRNEHNNIFIGPLKPKAYRFLKTITLFLDRDQLSNLITVAYYDSRPGDPPPVTDSVGTACSHFVPAFKDLSVAQAAVGATDLEMGKFMSAPAIAFTVTKSMYIRLCSYYKRTSFLGRLFQGT